jgi:hypothetical protein
MRPMGISIKIFTISLDDKYNNNENLMGDSVDLADLEFEQDFLQDKSRHNSSYSLLNYQRAQAQNYVNF